MHQEIGTVHFGFFRTEISILQGPKPPFPFKILIIQNFRIKMLK